MPCDRVHDTQLVSLGLVSVMLHYVTVKTDISNTLQGCSEQTALERQDLRCMCLAYHEPTHYYYQYLHAGPGQYCKRKPQCCHGCMVCNMAIMLLLLFCVIFVLIVFNIITAILVIVFMRSIVLAIVRISPRHLMMTEASHGCVKPNMTHSC